ncbi:MAG: dicarboxylate/amino acid:cation symporter [Betaproteobacteria bacterium]|nr:MAG: dicarboxylate/amino acid:cation symporter [Betaproteobacteria bacterium]
MKSKLTTWILIGMVAGIGVGWMCHELLPTPESAKTVAGYISLVTDIFLRLIKMIIAPLVFSTLVVGIAHMGDSKSLGRIGLKTMGWFICASLLSLLLGLTLVNILRPGDALNLPLPDAGASTNLKTTSLSLKEFVTHLVPRSVIEAMANNEILQIVIFSVFFGAGAASFGKKAGVVIDWIEQLSHVMLKVTGYVMALAPIAVFAAVAAIVTTQGLGILLTYGVFMGEFYFGILLLWVLLAFVGFLFLGPRIGRLISLIKEPILLAFSTASSEAAYPKTLEQLERFGASKKITSFVLPLGYSFNLDGSMMYCTFATLFIAQAYGVPRASLVVIAATLATFNIPEAGLLLIMGIDQFLDMGRSATNVVGNSVATAVVSKWEGELQPEAQAQAEIDRDEGLVAPVAA